MPSNNAVLFLRAQTAVHPGVGTSVGATDLPVQRERYTQWPNIQGSAVKGVLREAYRMHLIRTQPDTFKKGDGDDAQSARDKANNSDELKAIFGADVNAGDHAGAVAVTDARILAFPIRSAKGVFAWVTCKGVLARFADDMKMAQLGLNTSLSSGPTNELAGVTDEGYKNLFVDTLNPARLVLEDLIFQRHDASTPLATSTKAILEHAGADDAGRRVVVLSDDAFTHIVRYCTEVTTRIALDYDTKRVKDGALFVLEMLPTETILYSVLLVSAIRDGKLNGKLTQKDVAPKIQSSLGSPGLLQIGGEETTGKGWCWAKIYREAS